MTARERDVEASLRTLVEHRGGQCLKWTCPGHSGVPDRIILLPGGIVIFAEVKRPTGGRLAPLQAWWRDRLRQLGFWSVVVADDRDLEALDAAIIDEMSRRRP